MKAALILALILIAINPSTAPKPKERKPSPAPANKPAQIELKDTTLSADTLPQSVWESALKAVADRFGGKNKEIEDKRKDLSLVDSLTPPTPPSDMAALKKELDKARKSLLKLKSTNPYIVIDTHANYLYLRTESEIILKAVCSTGSGGELIDSTTGRRWIFHTPKGSFKINSKMKDPWWRKPDWAFVEEGEPIPKDAAERYDPNMLGEYAMGFGKGYFIHGTLYQRLLGINVTHGCVRLGDEDLKKIFDKVHPGASVYIF